MTKVCVFARCEIYFLVSLSFILHQSQRPEPPPGDLRLSNALSNPSSHDQINFIINFTGHMWRSRLYSPFWISTQSSARQSTNQSFIVFRRPLWGGLVQTRSFTGTLQAPASRFRFPAPSSSQTERKRENNPSVYSLSPQS